MLSVNVLRHILLLVLAYILQTTWVYGIAVFDLRPNLVILILLFIALYAGSFEATILGFLIGFIQDLNVPENLGLNAFTNSLVAFGVGWLRLHIVGDNIQVQVVAIFSATLVHNLLHCVLDSAIPWSGVLFFWGRYGFGAAVYTSALGALIAVLLQVRRNMLPETGDQRRGETA